ncbi:MAG: hypothetical protein ACHQPI_04815 [Thermoanaerobaculia bacterium]
MSPIALFAAAAFLLVSEPVATATLETPVPAERLRTLRTELDLRVDLAEQRMDGTARLTAKNEGPVPVREVPFLLYRLLTVRGVRDAGGVALPFTQQVVAFEDEPRKQVTRVVVALPKPVGPGEAVSIEVAYGGFLAGYVETGSLYIKDRISEEFSIVREDCEAYPTVGPASNRGRREAGLPDFDWAARITVPSTHVVASGGELVERVAKSGWTTFVYRGVRPAWRLDFAIARYEIVEKAPLRIFCLPGDAPGGERLLKAGAAALQDLERRFGPRPGAGGLAVIEIPDGWGSQASEAAIIQSAAAFRDPARTRELYHELTHLWNPPSLDRPDSRWNEGLATFLEDLLTERLDGRLAVRKGVDWMAKHLRERLAAEPRLARVPMRDYGREDLTGDSYSVGGLLFYLLYQASGEKTFDAILRGFIEASRERGGRASDLAARAKLLGGDGADRLFREWFETAAWADLLSHAATVEELVPRYRPPG